MPRKFVDETSLKITRITCHNWAFIPSVVDLTRITTRA
jgi:hypothetical protein